VSLTVIGVLAVVGLAGFLLAPVAESRSGKAADRARVRKLVDRPDGGTLDPFALRPDKAYVFSTDGRAAVAYRYVNGVGLASGDPVGAPDAFGDAISTFVAKCDANGWRPAIIGVREELLPQCIHAGLRSHYLGDEALIDVPTFGLDGRRMRPVRQAFNRVSNFGLTCEIRRERDLSADVRAELRALADRARNGAPERGFSMALDAQLSGRDGDCVVAVTRTPEGAPLALQRYVPCRAGRGLSLDVMRREKCGPNGVNERMIVEIVRWAKLRGIEEVSLNFAFFRAWLDEGAVLSRTQSIETWFVRRCNPYFQIESLLRFNAKFHPRWVPRYLAYRSVGELGPVSLAALSAEAFLPFDRTRVKAS
jgi:lysyl-tRNA synthetase class 2